MALSRHSQTTAGSFDYSSHRWAEGDIAFLKPHEEFADDEYRALIAPNGKKNYPWGYLHKKATGHPVIILSRLSASSTHVAITPVSAYSSGPRNNFLPPWAQGCHAKKHPLDSRSFAGSALAPGSPHNALLLRHQKSMPKPKASWVYIQSVWVVPLTVLRGFTKSRMGLQVEPTSLISLRNHMEKRSRDYAQVRCDLLAAEPVVTKLPGPVVNPTVTPVVGPVLTPSPTSRSTSSSRISWARLPLHVARPS